MPKQKRGSRTGGQRHPKPRREKQRRRAPLVERSAKTVPYWAKGIYRERLERLRTLVTKSFLWHKPTKRHRREVARYDEYVFGGGKDQPRAFSKDKRAYKPKRQDRLAIAQQYAQMPDGFDALNVAFMPDLGTGTRYRFTADGNLIIRNQHIVREFRPFDPQAVLEAKEEASAVHEDELPTEDQVLASLKAGMYDEDYLTDFIDHVAELIADDPPDTLYQLQVGEHTFGGFDGIAMGKDALIRTLIRLFSMYHDDIHKWLVGVTIYQFQDQHEATGFDDPAKLAALGRAISRKRARKGKRA